MAIEDDPLFEQWNRALKTLVDALQMHAEAVRKGDPAAVLNAARGSVSLAQSRYDELSAKLGETLASALVV